MSGHAANCKRLPWWPDPLCSKCQSERTDLCKHGVLKTVDCGMCRGEQEGGRRSS